MAHTFNLASLFYDEVAQRRLIATAATAFDELMTNHQNYTSSVIYGPTNLPDYDDDKAPQALDLSGLLGSITPETSYISKEYSHSEVSKFFKEINATAQPYAVLTWVVLVIFFICPRIREIVAENTEPALYTPYFDNFEERFTVYLCGILVHKRDRKEDRSQIKTEALHPLQMTYKERLFFDFLRSSPPERYCTPTKPQTGKVRITGATCPRNKHPPCCFFCHSLCLHF